MIDSFINQLCTVREYVCAELRRLDREQSRLIVRFERLREAAEARRCPIDNIPAQLRRHEDGGARSLRYEYFQLRRLEHKLREDRHNLAEFLLSCTTDCEDLEWETLTAVNLLDGLCERYNAQWREIVYTTQFLERTYYYNGRARRFLWNFPLD